MLGLYRPVGGGHTPTWRRATRSAARRRQTLGFGCFFFDADLDGLQDLLVVNGHIDDTISDVQARVSYAEPPHLFHNQGGGQFRDVAPVTVGGGFAPAESRPRRGVRRLRRRRRPDVVITTNGGPAYLYRNDVRNGNQVIRVRASRHQIEPRCHRHARCG